MLACCVAHTCVSRGRFGWVRGLDACVYLQLVVRAGGAGVSVSVSVCDCECEWGREMNIWEPKALRLLRNGHFEVHNAHAPATKSALRGFTHSAAPETKSALRGSQSAAPATKSALRGCCARREMPLNLRIEVHKVLRLLRNLHFEVVALATKFAFRGSQSAALATKSAHRGWQKALCLPRNLHLEADKCWARHEICTSRFTKCFACHEICTSRVTRRACHKICTSRLKRGACREICKRTTCPKVTIHCKICISKLRSLAPVTKSRLSTTKARGFPCACHEKWPPCPKMRTAPKRERSRDKRPPPTQI